MVKHMLKRTLVLLIQSNSMGFFLSTNEKVFPLPCLLFFKEKLDLLLATYEQRHDAYCSQFDKTKINSLGC